MVIEEIKNKIFDLEYEDLSSEEAANFVSQIKGDREAEEEWGLLKNFRKVLSTLPDQPVSPAITVRILEKTTCKKGVLVYLRDFLSKPLARPAFSMPIAALILLTVGWFGFQGQWFGGVKTTPLVHRNVVPVDKTTFEEIDRPLTVPPPQGYYQPKISLVSQGTTALYNPLAFEAPVEPSMTSSDLDPLVSEQLATFKFQRALRLRAAGDYEAVSELLGKVLMEHPNYSRSSDVLTIRIDALFRVGKNYDALKEFSYLKSYDPDRAEILAQRWLRK